MPARDGTGPNGTGPYGRGLGPCGSGQAARGRGRGFFGARPGWGFRQGEIPTADEKEILEQRKNWLQTQLDTINQTLHKPD